MGAAPNTPATGSHTEVQRKGNPNREIAGHALAPSSTTNASSSRGSDSARPVSAARYSRSPVLRPRSAGRAWISGCDGWVAGDSIGSVVIARKRIQRLSRPCNSRRPKKTPRRRIPPCGGSDSRKEGLPGCRCPHRLAAGRDALQTVLDPGAELLGQRRVAERRGARLPLSLRPPDE